MAAGRPAGGGAGPAAQRPGDVLPRPAAPGLPSGRPPRHGAAFKLADERSWPAPAAATVTQATRYGTARAAAWYWLHQQLASPRWMGRPPRRAAGRRGHPHPAAGRSPARRPQARTGVAVVLTRPDLCRCGEPRLAGVPAPLRYRTHVQVFKQVLGWTRPRLRDPAAADRWTWLVIACYVQLRLARHLAADLRLPWQPPCPPGRLTPARVRRGFRGIRQALPGSGQRAETRQTRPRPPARIEEPPPGHPPRRGQDRQAR